VQALFVAEKLGMGGRKRIGERFDIPLIALVEFVAEGKFTTNSTK